MTTLDRQVHERLRDNDARYTKGRRAVVEALARADGPRSAAELSVQIGDVVPLSSLYRSLALLEEAGVVVPHYATKGLTRYELAEWLTAHHHHLVCVNCGAVEDIEIPAPYETQVRALVDDIGAIVSFTPLNHALEIEGHCSRCA
ncbi:MAG: Fur family transcriptional regulator [Acidimicrobiia bacterium]